jgi:hypothetical protein
MNDNEQTIQKRWFQYPMVWLVIFFPALAVVAGIITIIIAVNTEDGLVVDNYYKKGLEINKIIKHDQMAQQFGLSAFVDANSETGEILVSLSSDKKMVLNQEITFSLIHRTRSGQDQETVLIRHSNSAEYRGYLKPPIIEGLWTIQISSPQGWRLKQNLTTQSALNILMNITS